jgi:hypothetical protein
MGQAGYGSTCGDETDFGFDGIQMGQGADANRRTMTELDSVSMAF